MPRLFLPLLAMLVAVSLSGCSGLLSFIDALSTEGASQEDRAEDATRPSGEDPAPELVPDRHDPAWAALSAAEQEEACRDAGITIGCQVKVGECAWLTSADPNDPGTVAGWAPEVPSDQGPRAGASGETTFDDSGVPVAYVVAAGDDPGSIAERHCIALTYLHAVNSADRGGAGGLMPGDVLNLDAQAYFAAVAASQ